MSGNNWEGEEKGVCKSLINKVKVAERPTGFQFICCTGLSQIHNQGQYSSGGAARGLSFCCWQTHLLRDLDFITVEQTGYWKHRGEGWWWWWGGVVVLTQTNHTAVSSVTWLEPLPWDLTSPLCHAKDLIPDAAPRGKVTLATLVSRPGGGRLQHQEKGDNLLSSGFLKDRLTSFYKKKNVRREVSGHLLTVRESSLPNAKTDLGSSVHLYRVSAASFHEPLMGLYRDQEVYPWKYGRHQWFFVANATEKSQMTSQEDANSKNDDVWATERGTYPWTGLWGIQILSKRASSMIQPAASAVRNEQQMWLMVWQRLTEVGHKCPNIAFIQPKLTECLKKWPLTKFEVYLWVFVCLFKPTLTFIALLRIIIRK